MDTVVIFYNVNIYLKNIWYGNLLKKLTFCWTTSSCVPISVGLYTSSGISLVLSWGLNGHCHNILHCWYLFEEHFGKLLQELTLWLMYHFHLIGYRFLWFCIRVFHRISSVLLVPTTKKLWGFNNLTYWQSQCPIGISLHFEILLIGNICFWSIKK